MEFPKPRRFKSYGSLKEACFSCGTLPTWVAQGKENFLMCKCELYNIFETEETFKHGWPA